MLQQSLLALGVIGLLLFDTPILLFGQKITDLGSLGPFGCPTATSINSSGQVVGDSHCPSPAAGRAFLFSAGALTVLPTLYPDPNNLGQYLGSATAWGINRSGQIAGISDLPPPDGSDISPSHAFLYSGGTMIDLDPGDAGNSFGRSINDAGQVAGIIGWESPTQHAALFNAGTVTDLRTLGGQASAAIGINNQGQIVGWSQLSGQFTHHAFVWQNGQMVDITPSLPAGESSEAYAVNDRGQIVGIQQFPSGTHAALWQDGKVTDLGTLAGRPFSEAWGINSSGWIVGDSSGLAFLYRDGNMTDLNTLLPPNSGWNLTGAFAINDRGQIAGSGFHNGAFRSFLMTLNSCQVDAADLFVSAGGSLSLDGKPTAMNATFVPGSSSGNPVGLAAKADQCGFAKFDWVQLIDVWPGPSGLFAESAPTSPIIVPPDLSFNDPLQGGYTYQFQDPNWFLNLPNFPSAAPFYYSPLDIPSGCAKSSAGNCEIQIMSDQYTLNYFDSPKNSCLPGGVNAHNPAVCQGISTVAIGESFETQLVGVVSCIPSSQGCNSSGYMPSAPLLHWTWVSTFNGTSSTNGTGGVSAGPVETSSTELPTPNSGTGGITITSVNGVPQSAPSVTCIATPNALWPPNGKSVEVTVSGVVTAGTQAIGPSDTTYQTTDKYMQVQPSGLITLREGGSYSFTVTLIAARDGGDQDGRTYTISVIARDGIGNVGPCTVVVNVPHDQRR